MRILAVYNTRGMVAPLEILRKRHLEHCDLFVHCGNAMVDYRNEFIQGYVVIRGNDDFENHYLRDYIVTLKNQRLLLMNNIEYRGTDGLDRLSKFVDSLFDPMTLVICAIENYGFSKRIGNVIYVSPGDASDKQNNTYAVIETETDNVRINFFDISSGDLVKSDYYENTISIIE